MAHSNNGAKNLVTQKKIVYCNLVIRSPSLPPVVAEDFPPLVRESRETGGIAGDQTASISSQPLGDGSSAGSNIGTSPGLQVIHV